MGRQINFYADQDTVDELVNFVFESGFQLISYHFLKDPSRKYSSLDEYKAAVRESHLFIIRSDFRQLIPTPNNDRIDDIVSPVIELMKTFINTDEKWISRSRLWVETQYYDQEGNIQKKNPELIKGYERFVRWVKKHIPYRERVLVARQHSTGEMFEYVYKDYITDEIQALCDEGYKLM